MPPLYVIDANSDDRVKGIRCIIDTYMGGAMLLFCNVGWMEHYQGLDDQDDISGGGDFVKKNGMGGEVCNFSRVGSQFYGYVQPPGKDGFEDRQITIERLGGSSDDDSISGITVVWTATRPSGGTVVIGWYNNATVFRYYQKFKKLPEPQRQNNVDGFWMTAPCDEAKLLTVDERTCEIPRGVKGSMGQSNIWYADPISG
jgi:hypothetical protein